MPNSDSESLTVTKNTITAKINVNSSKESVWNTITNFDTYPQWNKLSVKIKGNASEGSIVQAYGASGAHLDLKITEVIPNSSITWVDVTWFTVGGLMGGWRRRSITDNPDGTGVIFSNHFEYTGPFSFILKFLTHNFLEEGMQIENRGLKQFIEQKPSNEYSHLSEEKNINPANTPRLSNTIRLFSLLPSWLGGKEQEDNKKEQKVPGKRQMPT